AWMPYALMSVFLLLTGLVRQKEGTGPVHFGAVQTNYMIPIPALHNESHRDPQLHVVRAEQVAAQVLGSTNALTAAVNMTLAHRLAPRPEKAEFNFAWLTAPGTAVFFAAVVSIFLLGMNLAQVRRVLVRTIFQMKIPIPTIACMLGLSYVTRYAGM